MAANDTRKTKKREAEKNKKQNAQRYVNHAECLFIFIQNIIIYFIVINPFRNGWDDINMDISICFTYDDQLYIRLYKNKYNINIDYI